VDGRAAWQSVRLTKAGVLSREYRKKEKSQAAQGGCGELEHESWNTGWTEEKS
jgi:hypothetical protein